MSEMDKEPPRVEVRITAAKAAFSKVSTENQIRFMEEKCWIVKQRPMGDLSPTRRQKNMVVFDQKLREIADLFPQTPPINMKDKSWPT